MLNNPAFTFAPPSNAWVGDWVTLAVDVPGVLLAKDSGPLRILLKTKLSTNAPADILLVSVIRTSPRAMSSNVAINHGRVLLDVSPLMTILKPNETSARATDIVVMSASTTTQKTDLRKPAICIRNAP